MFTFGAYLLAPASNGRALAEPNLSPSHHKEHPCVPTQAFGHLPSASSRSSSRHVVTTPTPTTEVWPATCPTVESGEPIPDERCEANRAAGTITYLSSFDFAATASIVEVLVAEERGYFDELCLDVDIQASFSTDNYPLIAANDAQFSSGGSFSEIVTFANANEADFVAVAVDGRTAIDGLIVKPGAAATIEDLARYHDRREGQAAERRHRDARRRRPGRGHRLRHGSARGIRSRRHTSRSSRSSASPGGRATNRASSNEPASTSRCSTRPRTMFPARSG